MLKIKFSIITLFLCVTAVVAQKSINEYKYVIVPIQYDFQKTEDAYQLNSLTKFLFNKAGYQAFLSNEDYPDDLSNNGCLAMTARLNNNSKMLSTKMNFDLVDCNNKVIYSSKEAKSKEKDYKAAYQESIRGTFESIKNQNYSYKVPVIAAVSTLAVTDKQETIKTQEVAPQTLVNQASVSEKNVVIPVIAATKVVSETKPIIKDAVAVVTVDTSVLYAQPTSSGFQLVDGTPKVIYVLLKTSVKDMYLISGNNNNGIIYKANNGIWKADYYENDKLMSKELNIKFF